MTRGPIIASAVDLTSPDNVVQARHELHQAIDFGGDTQCAAWARKWGEPTLAAGEEASRDGWGEDWSPPPGVDRAFENNAKLRIELAKDKPDIARCRTLTANVGDALGTLIEGDDA